jgi:hypothetical protein
MFISYVLICEWSPYITSACVPDPSDVLHPYSCSSFKSYSRSVLLWKRSWARSLAPRRLRRTYSTCVEALSASPVLNTLSPMTAFSAIIAHDLMYHKKRWCALHLSLPHLLRRQPTMLGTSGGLSWMKA